ncbi:MAG TPA: alpha amylase C-terminal domain-containing protein, partial [Ignavibacteria bacterium]|nr:alpha amylase C-terminal domain-containing protein [Ignavibacteria bacterium]
SKDPIHRKYHQGKITFSLWYAFSENFVLPVSHDEVVHGKKSLLEKMPGDNWQKFANLRLFLGFMFGHPGKKLKFMTIDIAQYNEWYSEVTLERNLLELDMNKKLNKYVEDLNHFYIEHPALHEIDFESKGFQWIDFSDAINSVLSFYRISKDENEILLFTFNMTPTVRNDYLVGAPKHGFWKEIFNSNAEIYGGSGLGNMGGRESEPVPVKQWENSIKLTLPPLAVNVYMYSGIMPDEVKEEVIDEDDIDKLYIETGGGD